MSEKNSETLSTYKNKFWFNKPSFFINCSAKDQVQLLNSLAEREKNYLADSMSKWGRFYNLSSEMQKTIFGLMSPDAQYKILSAKYDTLLDVTGHISGYSNLSPEQRSNLYLDLSDGQKEKLKNCSAYQFDLKIASFVSKGHFIWNFIYQLTHKYCDDGLEIYCNERNQFFHKVGINAFLAVVIAICIISVSGVVIPGAALIAIAASLFLFEANIISLRTFGGNSITRGLNFENVIDNVKTEEPPSIKQNEQDKENDISTDISDDLNQSKSSEKNCALQLTKAASEFKNAKGINVKE